jgi:hypothetical protein
MSNDINSEALNEILSKVILENSINEYIIQAEERSLIREITCDPSLYEEESIEKLPRLGYMFERIALEKFSKDKFDKLVKENFLYSYRAWRSIINLPSENQEKISSDGLELIKNELSGELLPPEVILSFRIAVSGIMSDKLSEARLELKKFNLTADTVNSTWADKVRHTCFLSFIYLCRKQNGWEDIDKALQQIELLKELQKEYEELYLNSISDKTKQYKAAFELVGYYNLAQIVTITGNYLKDGDESFSKITDKLDRFKDQALEAFNACRSVYMLNLTELLWAGCWKIAYNAIWTHVNVLGEKSRSFAKLLSKRGRPNPVIELWPSQQEALKKNLLDPYRKSILVEMPTSAGKTLLAKFAILQTKALNPHGKIMYIVPTRALVNQVTIDLRTDFSDFELMVEQAVPSFELNPTEEKLLNGVADILVTTPEKLDLLIRKDHPITKDIALVIADEAHNIADGIRGARLELLLGTLKRERAGARFLLLSPFLPNDKELVTWLGEDQALPPIGVDWKPSRTVVGLLKLSGRGNKRAFFLETVPSSKSLDISPGKKIKLAPKSIVEGKPSITRYSIAGSKILKQRGAVLILCQGRGTAINRAKQIAASLDIIHYNDELVQSVCKFLAIEHGPNSPLIELIQKGVAYHHSGISHETRWLIEGLIKKNRIKVICGTTTLAQGVNFPISSVIMETLNKGNEKITYSDFWNIAGRAGRALVDTTGIIAFPTPNAEKEKEVKEFLQKEAEEISSQLASIISLADDIANKFNLSTVKKCPELASLMQFLAHALRVSGEDDLSGEIEDLLRASLVYHQAKKIGTDISKKLIEICKAYLNSLKGKQNIVKLADQTGFATPSVLKLLSEKKYFRDLNDFESWRPDKLFGGDITPLTRRIDAIAELPEMQLGRGQGQPFNSEEVAKIISEWVNGERLDIMAMNHPIGNNIDPGLMEAEFGKYLFSNLIGKASWGLGALQGVYLSDLDEKQSGDVGYIPSMVFFGVPNKEAVWFRMIGAPRFLAKELAELWKRKRGKEPDSHQEIRDWVNKLSEEDWRSITPKNIDITPKEIKRLWKEFWS